ncbi:MAG TPA: glycosyltransferase family 39 protein [Terriglobales bacterium]|nr:glycosyltransferase family 39 protein [Terriglobales bacterium]
MAIFVVALLARLRAIQQLLPGNSWRGFYANNESARIAWSVASGFGFSSPWPRTPLLPTAVEPPVYPYLLAGIFKVAGPYSDLSLWLGVELNAVLSALTAVVLFHLGRRVFGASTGALAAWIWAIWLYAAVISIRLWESSLSGFLLLSGLLLLFKLQDSLRPLHWWLFGGLAGFALLTNTTFISLFPLFWIWLWITYRRRRISCGKVLWSSIAVCVLMLVPWTIRNYETFHRLMPVRDNLGLELWIGNHEGVAHLQQFAQSFPLIDPSEYNRLGEMRFMETKRELALKFIRERPAQFVKLCGQRCYSYWTGPDPVTWLPISLLAWTGAIIGLWRKREGAVPLAIVLLVFPFIYYVTHTWPTYRHPMEPVIVLLATYAVLSATELLIYRAGGGSVTPE